ncbi:hypothetical protein DVR12_23870 [Chitinophaga silvatica]|uniref:DUF4476 domain-containing protein n=1 Tax=Chitinophaga silvatica TaxID=2282649 RepID=A0A3E1Y3J8_9BACT|nr:hypothetical protein [Chitinophaga silvatica]RFS19275.1 hypothetical protein DVR12_23870 [Chitinophaga silvatica]
MRITFIGLLLFSTLFAKAQDYPEPSKESVEYTEQRSKITTPPYGLAKVKAMIAKVKADDNDNMKLSNKDYNSLSLREKFTYNMIHAEEYSQNCDVPTPVAEAQKQIFGQVPSSFNEYTWSDRQLNFFKDNKDSVIAIIKESVNRSKRVGVNYKEVIVLMNATEMIPFLEEVYQRDKKDHDILTVFLLLMKNNNYQPFLTASSYPKLYGENVDYYSSHIAYNSANEQLILQRVNDFYKNRK